jgi:hypothetical protein
MSVPAAWPQNLDFFGTALVIEPSPGQLSGDAGLLPIRQFDERVGLTQSFAEALDDPRDPDLTEHSFLEMVRSRVYSILAGYEDQNDHDTLRHDPVFKLLAGRSPDDADLASQPTLSRFENTSSSSSRTVGRPLRLSRGRHSGQGMRASVQPETTTSVSSNRQVARSPRSTNCHSRGHQQQDEDSPPRCGTGLHLPWQEKGDGAPAPSREPSLIGRLSWRPTAPPSPLA